LLAAACGSLHLAVNTRGGTFTRKNCAMPGTLRKVLPYERGSTLLLKRIMFNSRLLIQWLFL
jgi:hypothetical protein